MNPRVLLDRFKKRWLDLSQTQKVLFIISCAGLLAAIFYLIPLLIKPTYAPLFTGLDSKDAGAVIEKLQDMQIEYELADQGQTIKVPEDQVYEARIQLASSGLLQGGSVGFELFDQNKMGVTDFEQQVDYQRALQGELERTIKQLDEVEQARVHLVLPRESVFLDEQEPPSASVALKLKPLSQLKPEQVRGIADLIVGSVEGLKIEDVHIIDMQGNILSEDIAVGSAEFDSAHSTLKQQQVKRAYEKELEKRVQNMLNKILGPNRAVAMVTADINFNKEETTSTTYEPGEIVSQQEIEETNQGTGLGGVPGTDAQGAPMYPAGANSESNSSREETITNYQLGNTQQTVVQAPGALNSLSAAVVVDGELTNIQLNQIEGLVSTAIGYDEARGDKITVTNMAFDTSYQEQLKEEMEKESINTQLLERKRLIYYTAAGITALLLLALTVLIIRRRKNQLGKAEMIQESPKAIKDLLEEADDPLNNSYTDITQDKLSKIARERPKQMADIIKVWLSED